MRVKQCLMSIHGFENNTPSKLCFKYASNMLQICFKYASNSMPNVPSSIERYMKRLRKC